MWLTYWYEDEISSRKEGSKPIYLTSYEFERIFGFKEKYVFLTMESDDKGYDPNTGTISHSQLLRTRDSIERMNDIWKNLKNIKRIRDVAVPYRIECDR